MKDIDWEDVSSRITEEENEALQKYLPLLKNYTYEWLIFHEDEGTMYGIDIWERGFHYPYTNGLYSGSNGAGEYSYHRLIFTDGYYTREKIADITHHRYETHEEYYIDGVKKTAAEFESWKQKYLTEQVPRYTPLQEEPSAN